MRDRARLGSNRAAGVFHLYVGYSDFPPVAETGEVLQALEAAFVEFSADTSRANFAMYAIDFRVGSFRATLQITGLALAVKDGVELAQMMVTHHEAMLEFLQVGAQQLHVILTSGTDPAKDERIRPMMLRLLGLLAIIVSEGRAREITLTGDGEDAPAVTIANDNAPEIIRRAYPAGFTRFRLQPTQEQPPRPESPSPVKPNFTEQSLEPLKESTPQPKEQDPPDQFSNEYFEANGGADTFYPLATGATIPIGKTVYTGGYRPPKWPSENIDLQDGLYVGPRVTGVDNLFQADGALRFEDGEWVVRIFKRRYTNIPQLKRIENHLSKDRVYRIYGGKGRYRGAPFYIQMMEDAGLNQ